MEQDSRNIAGSNSRSSLRNTLPLPSWAQQRVEMRDVTFGDVASRWSFDGIGYEL